MEQKKLLFALVLTQFMLPFLMYALNVALPPIGKILHGSPVILAWIPTAYFLALAALQIPFGCIADIYGRKKILLTGILIFLISSILAAFSVSCEMILIFRTFQGIGAAMIFGGVLSTISSALPMTKRGKAYGWISMGGFSGMVLGPFLGGILTGKFGWQSVFYSVVPIALICFMLIVKTQEEWYGKQKPFDFKGAVLMALSMIFIVYGLSSIKKVENVIFVVFGLILLASFYVHEKKLKNPLVEIHLFKKKEFSYNLLSYFFAMMAMYPIQFLLSMYLQYFLRLPVPKTGFILTIAPLIIGLISPVSGWLSDKKNPAVVASIGIISLILSLSFIISLNYQFILLGLIIYGIGFGLFFTANTKLVLSAVGREFLGVGAGTYGTSSIVGMSIAMAIVISLMKLFIKGPLPLNKEAFELVVRSSIIVIIIFLVISLLLTILAKDFSTLRVLRKGEINEK